MAFTKQQRVSEVSPCLVYPHLHKDEGGAAIVFRFPMRRQRSGEAEEDKAQRSAGQQSDLDRFCKLLVSEPEGFDDFPKDDRPLSERAREYFSDTDMDYFVSDAIEVYQEVVSPRGFFRAA
jgi:hypothetical protein